MIRTAFKDLIKKPVFIYGLFAYSMVLLTLGLHQLETFGTIALTAKVIIYSLLTVAYAFFAFVANTEKDKLLIALFSAVVANLWLRLILPDFHRITIALDIVLFAVIIVFICSIIQKGYLNTKILNTNNNFTYLHATWALSCAAAEIFMHILHNENGSNTMGELVIVSICIGILLAIVLIIVGIKQKKGVLFFALFVFCTSVISIMISIIILTNLNYALDFSVPERETAVITDITAEYKRSHGRHSAFSGHIDYEFTINSSGDEIDIDVTSAEYEKYSIGDSIVLLRYKGALGVPYYVIESIEKMLPK